MVFEAVAGVAVLVICGLAGIGSVAWNRLSQPIPAPTLVRAVPSAPENLAGLPPAAPVQAAPVPAQGEPAPAPIQPAPSVVVADSPRAQKAPREATAKAIEGRADEGQHSDDVQSPSPGSKRAEAQESSRPESETQSAESKKGHFWGKLNPFHKANPFKKKKEDSALRSPSDATSPSRQD
jgi:type IV secretory pathway VirB10-like protein